MRKIVFLGVLASLILSGWAQRLCEYCKSDRQIEQIPYRDHVRGLCSRCRQNSAPCSVCHQPSPGKPYRDGRNLCPGCRASGVFDKARVTILARRVQDFLVQQLGPEAKHLPPIQLVDLDELQTKFSESGRSLDVVAFYQPYNPELVYLLSGESELESCSHLAHELTHAWQSRACPQQDRALVEGFACWVQYQYLLAQGSASQARLLTSHQDPDYGASLVKLLARSQSLGQARFLSAVKKARKVEDV